MSDNPLYRQLPPDKLPRDRPSPDQAARAAGLIAVAEDLAGEFSLRPLLERILRRCTELLGCDAGSICSVDEAAGTYRKEADIGVACQSGQVFPLTEGMTGAVVARRAPVWFARYDDVPGGHVSQDSRATLRGVIGVPLEWRGRIIGACIVFSRDERRIFGPDDADLLRLFAKHAAVALANARMHEAAEERARSEAAAAERDRMLAELHDTLAQRLVSVRVHVDSARQAVAGARQAVAEAGVADDHLRQASAIAGDALVEARLTLLGLAPSPLDGRTLEAALRAEVAWAQSIGSLEVRLVSAGIPVPLYPRLSREVLWIAREALANIVGHAQARTVRLGLLYEQAAVSLLVQDDGQGFDPRSGWQSHRFGLRDDRAGQGARGDARRRFAAGLGHEAPGEVPLPGAVGPAAPSGASSRRTAGRARGPGQAARLGRTGDRGRRRGGAGRCQRLPGDQARRRARGPRPGSGRQPGRGRPTVPNWPGRSWPRRGAKPSCQLRCCVSYGADCGPTSPRPRKTSVKTVKAIGLDLLYAMWTELTAGTDVPVTLHLDHCPDRSVISACLRKGWNSVLFDGSSLPVPENQRQTIEVVAEARSYGASVEGEIEAITGVEDDLGSDEVAASQSLPVALDFIRATGVDVFAPAIGNAHGVYHTEPKLDAQRVSDIVAAQPVPIALHGGTGLTDAQFTDLIARGCSKVNISTALKVTYMKANLEFLREAERRDRWEPPSLFTAVRSAVVDMAAEHMRRFGSVGKA